MQTPIVHKVGFGDGKLYEYPDGRVEYTGFLSLQTLFSVNIDDVTGFSSHRANDAERLQYNVGWGTYILSIHGLGGTLAQAPVNATAPKKIEAWFRAHPKFRAHDGRNKPSQSTPKGSLADELNKLIVLLNQGALTNEEFQELKQRLLRDASY